MPHISMSPAVVLERKDLVLRYQRAVLATTTILSLGILVDVVAKVHNIVVLVLPGSIAVGIKVALG